VNKVTARVVRCYELAFAASDLLQLYTGQNTLPMAARCGPLNWRSASATPKVRTFRIEGESSGCLSSVLVRKCK
jgi:hypothetical protein